MTDDVAPSMAERVADTLALASASATTESNLDLTGLADPLETAALGIARVGARALVDEGVSADRAEMIMATLVSALSEVAAKEIGDLVRVCEWLMKAAASAAGVNESDVLRQMVDDLRGGQQHG